MLQHTLTPDQEKATLKKLLEGDEKAFDFFYEHYSLPVYRKLLKMIKVEFVAEEILQDVFIKVWEKRHLIDPEKGLKCYIYKIAQNMVYDFYRNLAREDQLQAEIKYAFRDMTSDAATDVLLKETRQLLEMAIEQLPEQQKIVFRLCKQEGKTYDEVSQLLGISKSTINGHIVRATRKVKNIMFHTHHISYSLVLPLLSFLLNIFSHTVDVGAFSNVLA
jgi:RNA polymerase sigma-70 factor (ECF subfamily)